MSTLYPIRFADQLRQHLKGLRKKRGFTQAKLGQLLGVSQARIAEIEANPGLVNLDQLLQIFSALGATLSLEELEASTPATERSATSKRIKSTNPDQVPVAAVSNSASSPTDWKGVQHSYVTRYAVNVATPYWHRHPIGNAVQQVPSALGSVADATSKQDASAKPEQSTQRTPDTNKKPASKRSFTIRPKKGSW
jgi:HTH-type transcriptional regulator / antitoxin HipB